MELIDAYKLYENKIKEESTLYSTIVGSDEALVLSSLSLLKNYRNYILLFFSYDKSPRIDNIKDISTMQAKALNTLLESCVTVINSFQLDPELIIVENDDIIDPYNMINIILNDYMTAALSPDDKYEDIMRSIFNIIIEKDFTKLLKSIFLKFAHTKSK